MRNSILGAAAVAVAVLATSTAFADDVSAATHQAAGYNHSDNVRIVRFGEFTRGGSRLVKKHNDHKGAMLLINSDRALANQLRNRGVQFKNVVGADKAMNGDLIIFIK